MNTLKWFVIGLHLYVFPPEPEIGDIEGLKKWKPSKKSIIETLRFRFKTRTWAYTTGNSSIFRNSNPIIKPLGPFKEGGYTSDINKKNKEMKQSNLTINIEGVHVVIKKFRTVYRIETNFRPSEYPELTRFLDSEFCLTNIHNNEANGGFYCLGLKDESMDIVAVLTAGIKLYVINSTPVNITCHGKA